MCCRFSPATRLGSKLYGPPERFGSQTEFRTETEENCEERFVMNVTEAEDVFPLQKKTDGAV